MSTNLVIYLPSRPTECFQLSSESLKVLGFNSEDLLYKHYCSPEDQCRGSYPCFKSDIFNHVVSKLYNVNLEKFYLLINGKLTDKKEHNKNLNLNHRSTPKDLINVTVLYKLLGGKGGFGKILKTQSNKKRQSNNLDSCRNLQGQRIRTVRLSDQMNKWKESESVREKLGDDVYKLPKKDKPSENIKPEKFCDPKYVETVKKEVSKVKETVLRGFDRKLEKESQDFKLCEELESKRSTLIDSCSNIYDL
ncbi:Telomere stability and silencing family protein [Theileria parva strain Muguga]|uniref:SDE2-like domain-containing protein n=1 Tax=Theileria parva TaxID=5875 RepID=Q4MZ49_THEPA|nr:Telomere stability and silencing family protein [Theileria parva strain Muguga]EAN30483.1 Telomere stability and silencing family protein [Theileria parva strain Muguga]|eukprot:XP_762766.1 hypothetical protein [Theileria parva strain Muguga]